MENYEAVDVHNHYVSPGVVRELRERGERYGVRVEGGVGGNPVFVFPDRKTSPLIAPLTDLRGRLAHMARVGISRAVLSTWIELQGHGLGEERARLLSMLINSELAKAVRENPARFLGVANLPLPYGRAAAEELEAALEEGLSGAMVPTSVLGVDLDSDFMEPVWAKAEELDAIERAAKICDRAAEALSEAARPGVKKFELKAAVAREILGRGASYNFIIIGSTPMSNPKMVFGNPYPSARVLREGDIYLTR